MESIIETPQFEIAEANILDLEQKLTENGLDHCFLCEVINQPTIHGEDHARKTVVISSLLPLAAEDAQQVKKQLLTFQGIIPEMKSNYGIKNIENTL